MIRIGILGREGKMGRALESLVLDPEFSSRVSLTRDEDPDLWIEFSSPAGALELCKKISGSKKHTPLLVGSTGWSVDQSKELEKYGNRFPLLRASNYSFGIQLCRMSLLLWKNYPEIQDWKVTIREVHHTEKKDSPSGTALTLKEALGADCEIISVREGGVIGLHEVTFLSPFESITLTHEAKDRRVFAAGALRAAIHLAEMKNLPKRVLTLDDLYLRREA